MSREASARYRATHRSRIQAAERSRYQARGDEIRARKLVTDRARRKACPEGYILKGLKQRCRDCNHVSYEDYGGRGIMVSPVFDGPGGLERFLAAVGPRPTPRHTIERIENARGYEPGNLRWATQAEQNRNQRANRVLTLRGRSQCLADWAIELGIDSATIRARLDRLGWSEEKALTHPLRRDRRRSAR